MVEFGLVWWLKEIRARGGSAGQPSRLVGTGCENVPVFTVHIAGGSAVPWQRGLSLLVRAKIRPRDSDSVEQSIRLDHGGLLVIGIFMKPRVTPRTTNSAPEPKKQTNGLPDNL